MEASPERIERITMLLMQLMRIVRESKLTQSMQEMSLNQHMVLSYLYAEGPGTISQIRELLGCAPSTASELVDRLVRQKLVKKQKDAQDGRIIRIDLTPHGHNLLRASFQELRETNRSVLSYLEDEDQLRLLHALEEIIELSQKAFRAKNAQDSASPK